MKTKRLLAASVAIGLAIGSANAQFTNPMTPEAIQKEMQNQISASGDQSVATLKAIAARALATGLSLGAVTDAMIRVADNDRRVVNAVISAAVDSGLNRDTAGQTVMRAAIAAGAIPTNVGAGAEDAGMTIVAINAVTPYSDQQQIAGLASGATVTSLGTTSFGAGGGGAASTQ